MRALRLLCALPFAAGFAVLMAGATPTLAQNEAALEGTKITRLKR
jgi:hypothetical protein